MPRNVPLRRSGPVARKRPGRVRPDREPLRSRTLKAGVVCGLAVLMAGVSGLAREAKAAPTPKVVTVGGEMCGACVKKIEAKFGPMPYVAQIRYDIDARTVTVVPKPKAKLAPQRLKAALEQIGKTPEKLVSPDGTFTAKPGS